MKEKINVKRIKTLGLTLFTLFLGFIWTGSNAPVSAVNAPKFPTIISLPLNDLDSVITQNLFRRLVVSHNDIINAPDEETKTKYIRFYHYEVNLFLNCFKTMGEGSKKYISSVMVTDAFINEHAPGYNSRFVLMSLMTYVFSNLSTVEVEFNSRSNTITAHFHMEDIPDNIRGMLIHCENTIQIVDNCISYSF